MKLRIFLLLTWIVTPAFAETTSAPTIDNFLICKHRGQVRSVYVEKSQQGCKTHYSKMGDAEVIGSGQNTSSCVQFLNNVRNNLEAASWKCRAAAKAQISTET